MAEGLEHVEADEDEVARLGDGNDLPTAALAVVGTLDDAGGGQRSAAQGAGELMSGAAERAARRTGVKRNKKGERAPTRAGRAAGFWRPCI